MVGVGVGVQVQSSKALFVQHVAISELSLAPLFIRWYTALNTTNSPKRAVKEETLKNTCNKQMLQTVQAPQPRTRVQNEKHIR